MSGASLRFLLMLNSYHARDMIELHGEVIDDIVHRQNARQGTLTVHYRDSSYAHSLHSPGRFGHVGRGINGRYVVVADSAYRHG
jgi:hypothetical protein